MPDVVREISKVRIPGVPEPYNFADLVARANASHSLQVSVVTASWITQHTPPTDDELGCLYLVPHSGHEPGVNDAHDEYVAIKDETTTPATYTWEKIGTIDIDLTNYSLRTHRHTVTFNIGVEDHIFTPEGTVAIPNFSGENTNFHGTTASIRVQLPASILGITVTVTESNGGLSNFTPSSRPSTHRTNEDGSHNHSILSTSYTKNRWATSFAKKVNGTSFSVCSPIDIDLTKILETTDILTVNGVISTNDLYLLSDPDPVEVCHAASSPTQVQNLSLSHDQASQITNHQTHDRADGTLGTAFDVSDANFLTKHETAVMHGVSVSADGTMQFTFKPINTDDALDVLTHTEHDVPLAEEQTPIPFIQAVPYDEGENTVNDYTQEEQITSGTVATTSGTPVTVATGSLEDASGGGSGSPVVKRLSALFFGGHAFNRTDLESVSTYIGYRAHSSGTMFSALNGNTGDPSVSHAHGTLDNPGVESWALSLNKVEIGMKFEGQVNISTPENGYTPHSIVGGTIDAIQIANVENFNSNFKGTTVSGTHNNPLIHNVANALLETSEASDLISEITVNGVNSIDLPYAIRGGITEVTVYGQCVYDGGATPSPSNPVDIVCNAGILTNNQGQIEISHPTRPVVVDSCSPSNTATVPTLLSVGSGANLFRDECNLITGEIIRRCEVFVYDGSQTLTTPRMSSTGTDERGSVIVQKLEREITESIMSQTLDAVSNTSSNTLIYQNSSVRDPEIQATYNFDPICDESVLTESSVMNVVRHNNTNNLFYIDPDIYQHITIDTDVYTPMNYVLWGMTGDKKHYMYKNAMSARKWAESNKYKIIPDTTQSGSFHWKVTINSTVKQGDVSWSAGDTISSIVSQMTGTTYLTFTEDNGFIKVSVSTSTDSTFTLTNTSNVVLKDLSKNCKVNGVLMPETHRAWMTKKVETMFPDSVYESSSNAQYAINGFNLSYRCGANLPKFKSYFETSATNHGGVDTYLPEDSTDARMSRVGFASCETGTTEAQALFNKYHGSWDEYIEASMAKINDTHTTGIEYISRDNGESQSKFLANVLTLDFDETTWIPAYPQAAAAAGIEFSGIGTGNLPTVHELLLFIDETKRVAINKALTNIGGTNISAGTGYWTVGEFNYHYAWAYNASQGTSNGGREKYTTVSARVVCSSN